MLALVFGAGAFAGASPAGNSDKIYASGYMGGGKVRSYNEIVTYAYKTTTGYVTDPELPGHYSNLTCGPVAAGNIVAWYDKENPDLIPGYDPGSYLTFYGVTAWFWDAYSSELDTMFSDLYTAMNGTPNGVTMQGYTSGLASYVSAHGYAFTLGSLMSGGTLDFASAKTALENGMLITIFMNGFNHVNIFPNPSGMYDSIPTEVYEGLHIMSVYGYYETKYYNVQGSNFLTYRYFEVAHGLGSGLSLLRLDRDIIIDACYITHIS